METIKNWYNSVVTFVALNPETSVAIYVATVAIFVVL